MSKKSVNPARSRTVKKARRRLDWTRRHARYTLHERLLSNRTSRRAFRRDDRQLTPAQQEAVQRLREDGIAVAHFDELVGDPGLWAELAGDCERFVSAAEKPQSEGDGDGTDAGSGGSDKDAYLVRRYPRISRRRRQQLAKQGQPLDDADARLRTQDPLLRLGLSEQVLDVVNAYRGLRTKLVDVDQWYTIPVGDGAGRIKSQNWHRDPEDLHVVKVFVYFSDVDAEAGPFQYIPGSQPDGRHGDLWPWTFRGDNYPSQEQMEERFPQGQQFTAQGRRGTIILCDTSGFHRGGFARSKPRVLSVYTYVSPASLRARKARRFAVDSPDEQVQLTEDARFALT
jgi:hypothetical protein